MDLLLKYLPMILIVICVIILLIKFFTSSLRKSLVGLVTTVIAFVISFFVTKNVLVNFKDNILNVVEKHLSGVINNSDNSVITSLNTYFFDIVTVGVLMVGFVIVFFLAKFLLSLLYRILLKRIIESGDYKKRRILGFTLSIVNIIVILFAFISLISALSYYMVGGNYKNVETILDEVEPIEINGKSFDLGDYFSKFIELNDNYILKFSNLIKDKNDVPMNVSITTKMFEIEIDKYKDNNPINDIASLFNVVNKAEALFDKYGITDADDIDKNIDLIVDKYKNDPAFKAEIEAIINEVGTDKVQDLFDDLFK